jgi:hypothetical protein
VFRCPLDDCDSDAITEFERGTANPYGLALSPDTVYLASWPQLLACPRTGCAGDETSLLTAPAVDSVVAGSTLYTAFLGFGEVSSCELAGCDTLTTVVDDIWPRGVAVDDTAIYATDNAALFSSALEGEPRVVRCPLSGCDADTLTVLADGDVSPYGIAEYDTRVYFTNVDHGTVLSIRKFD